MYDFVYAHTREESLCIFALHLLSFNDTCLLFKALYLLHMFIPMLSFKKKPLVAGCG